MYITQHFSLSMESLYGLRISTVIIALGHFLHRSVCTSPSYNNLTKLYTEVLTGYDTRIKPRENLMEFVNVTIEFSMASVTEFDIEGQILKTAGTFTLKWTDDYIQWEPDNFGGVDEIEIPISQVWSPTIVIGLGFESLEKLNNKEDFVIYHQSGEATWISKGVYSVFCETDTQYYPFDKQSCPVNISVTENLARHVNLKASDNSTSRNNFTTNSRWVLADVNFTSARESAPLVLNIILNRRSGIAMTTVIAPVSILQMFNSFAVLIPIDSGEKGSVAVTFFLAYGVFVSSVTYELPSISSRIPILSDYIVYMTFLADLLCFIP